MPLVVGMIVLVLGVLVLLASAFMPRWFPAEAAGARPDEAVAATQEQKQEVAAVERAAADSTSQASGSFVLETRDRYVAERRDFVEADLTAMTMKVYKGGEVALDLPIKSKGKVGSWWETPVGVYSVSLKKESHFSSFGKVYQPWSLVFQGNYFIHGWPYYPDGSPVSSQYSGGCIRLADEDARQVYDAAEVGMPVLVYKQPVAVEPLPSFSGDPLLQGDFTIIDVATGNVIRTRDAEIDTAFGAPLNLLTALTAVDYVNVEKSVAIGTAAGSARLAPVARASVLDLLRLLLSEGDTEAARAIAGTRGEEAFVRYMNAKAQAIGMRGTNVVSVDSDDAGNRTTPSDLALLTRYLAENRSFVLQLSSDPRGNLAYAAPVWRDLRFDERLRSLPGFFGGVPAGGASRATVAVVTLGKDGRQVAIAVSGSEDPADALSAAVQWLQAP